MAGQELSFSFLFRTDKGRIDRPTWWRGTLPLFAIAAASTLGWLALQPYARHDLAHEQFLRPATIAAYGYLMIYAFALILIAVCEYNLSAKRFRDRGKPAALAGILPLSLLLGGAVVWFIPRSFGAVPHWAAPLVGVVLIGIGLWNVVELGIRDAAARP